MPRAPPHKKKAAARARAGLQRNRHNNRTARASNVSEVIVIDDDTDSDDSSVVRVSENDALSIHSTEAEFLQDHSPDHATPGSDSETEEFCTSWTGGVSHDFCESDDSDEEWKDNEGTDGSEWESSDSEGDGMEVHGLEDDELLASLQEELKRELASLSKPTPYEEVMRTTGNSKHWENAESQRGLGYFGHSARTKREHAKKAQDKEKENEKSRNSASAALMRNFFARQPSPPTELTPTNRAGWYERDGRRITQPMVFPDDHAEHPGAAKGMKQVLLERGLWTRGLLMKCKKYDSDAVTCCAQRILELQPDFEEQRSLVQEVIEAAGHMCLFLPKYHCELNPIEFFWGVVKRFLRENCDYTFNTLRENLPKALASVGVELIRKWKHRMVRWMEAYRSGLSAKDAQFQVKAFGTKQYKSHRRIPETVATLLDA